jgi:hypothetical protein
MHGRCNPTRWATAQRTRTVRHQSSEARMDMAALHSGSSASRVRSLRCPLSGSGPSPSSSSLLDPVGDSGSGSTGDQPRQQSGMFVACMHAGSARAAREAFAPARLRPRPATRASPRVPESSRYAHATLVGCRLSRSRAGWWRGVRRQRRGESTNHGERQREHVPHERSLGAGTRGRDHESGALLAWRRACECASVGSAHAHPSPPARRPAGPRRTPWRWPWFGICATKTRGTTAAVLASAPTAREQGGARCA